MRKGLSAFLLAAWCGCALAQPYIVIDLGPTPANFEALSDFGDSLNSRGQVAGIVPSFVVGGHPIAAIGTAGDGVKTIVPPDLYSEPGGINESGNVVGILLPSGSTDFRAFFYAGGNLVDMGTLGGTFAFATGISNTNLATGESEDASGVLTAFLWNGSSMIGLPTPAGVLGSVGMGVSDNGNVTGLALIGSNPSNYQAFVWKGGKMVLLEGPLSAGNAVNNNGVVAGDTINGAAMWTASGTRIDLGNGDALAINGAGVIAGLISTPLAGAHASVWNQGIVTDLGSLFDPDVQSIAWSIDDAGAVFGLTYPNTSSNEVIEWAPSVPVALDALLRQVQGIGPGQSLPNKVQVALADFGVGDKQGTCGALTGFVQEVQAQTGKKIDQALAARLRSNAAAIEAARGCR